MANVRRKGFRETYWMLDRLCIGRKCFQPGPYEHRGAIGIAGSRNTGDISLMCMRNAHHGCPDEEDMGYDTALAQARKKEGWKNV